MPHLDQIAERVELLLARHEELQRHNALLAGQVAALSMERDSLRSRLQAARARVDVLVERLAAEAPASASAPASPGASPSSAAVQREAATAAATPGMAPEAADAPSAPAPETAPAPSPLPPKDHP